MVALTATSHRETPCWGQTFHYRSKSCKDKRCVKEREKLQEKLWRYAPTKGEELVESEEIDVREEKEEREATEELEVREKREEKKKQN